MSNRIVATPGDRLELLETFVRIADAGGITAAAKSLDAAQPTVSRRLQQLEAILDAKLVERSTHGLNLTPAGATLLPEAREVVDRWRGLETALDAQSSEIAGIVRVSASREIAAGLLPTLIADFLDQHPGVRVELRALDGQGEAMGAGDAADFTVVEGRPPSEDGVVKEIGRVRRVLAAAPSLAARISEQRGLDLARCEPLALEDAPMISSASLYRASTRFQGRGGETEDVRFDRIAAIDGLEPTLNLAMLGVGLAVLPLWRIAPFLETGQLIRVAADWHAQDSAVTLAWSPTRFRSPPATALLELLRDTLPALLED